MRWLLKPLQWIYCIYALLVFLVFMVPVFILAFIASFWGRIKGGNAIYKLCVWWGDIWFPLVFIFHKNIYEQTPEPGKQYIYVANHTSYLDAALIVRTIRQPLRPLGKVELSKLPLFGFIYKNAIVTVDRESAENRAQSVRILKSIISKGISIFFFPEGTFNETGTPLKDFYDGAFRIAIETATPIKPILFLDAAERLHYSGLLTLTPGKSRAVFLEEVSTQGLTLKDAAALKKKVHALMETKLRAYHAHWIKD